MPEDKVEVAKLAEASWLLGLDLYVLQSAWQGGPKWHNPATS